MPIKLPGAEDLSAPVSGRSGRAIASYDASAIGRGVATLGQGMQSLAGNLAVSEKKRAAEVDDQQKFETHSRFLQFEDAQKKAFSDAIIKAPVGADGFETSAGESYFKAAKAFIDTVPDALKPEYDQRLFGLESSITSKAKDFALAEKDRVAKVKVEDGQNVILGRLNENPGGWKEADAEADALAASSGRSAIDVDIAKREWRKRRAEALWTIDERQNGPEARSRLGVGSSGDAIDVVVNKIIGVESGGDPNARNPRSTAAGLGQFIDSTWLATVRAHRPDIAAGKSAAEIIALKTNGPLAKEMTAALTRDNAEYLTNRGVQITPGNLYLAHFLGSAGAVQVLKADPNAPIGSIVGQDVVRANSFLAGKSVADTRAWSDKKMGGVGGEVAPQYADLSFEERTVLYDKAVAAQEKADRDAQVQVNAQRTAFKDALSLGIETGEVVSDQQILMASIDDGDKATLLKALRTKREDDGNVQAALAQFAAGRLAVDPYDDKGRKTVDAAYGALAATVPADQIRPVTEEIVRQSGVVPKTVMNTLRQGADSRNPDQVLSAAQMAQRIATVDPTALGRRDGGAAVQKMADDFNHYVRNLNMDPADAAKRIADANDPERRRDRKAIEPAAKEFVKAMGEVDLAGEFNDAWFAGAPSLGFTPNQALGIQADFIAIAEDQFYQSNGDPEIAKNRALEQMKRLYGVTEFGGVRAVVKHPPEKQWRPSVYDSDNWESRVGLGGYYRERMPSLDYAKKQLAASLDKIAPGVDMSTVQLVTTPETDAMVRRGELPGYAVIYTDADGQYQTIPGVLWHPDVSKAMTAQGAQVEADRAKTIEHARRQQVQETQQLPYRQQTPEDFLSGNDPAFGDRDAPAPSVRTGALRMDEPKAPAADVSPPDLAATPGNAL